ncbi:recombinase family protein [Nonomuraea harbinensis]|uniref:Recombinase family protein n=1 Tax=Nonomuraea harbinensis TaxID=1286938 RepID=A0ABW1C6T7_9ACTN
MRHSTDKQTDARQRHALAALIASGAPVYEDPATSSRQLSLDRAGFTKLLHEAAVGDTIRIADAARLFRSVADIRAAAGRSAPCPWPRCRRPRPAARRADRASAPRLASRCRNLHLPLSWQSTVTDP